MTTDLLDTATKRLLIVDDDRRLRVALAHLLRRDGFECEVAEDGSHGLERMREQTFDLVITDMRMPGKTGLEMIVAAREELRPSPPFILLSGFHDHSPDALRAAGATRVLSKPLPPKELSHHVSEVLAGV